MDVSHRNKSTGKAYVEGLNNRTYWNVLNLRTAGANHLRGQAVEIVVMSKHCVNTLWKEILKLIFARKSWKYSINFIISDCHYVTALEIFLRKFSDNVK
jgi:hypothetical protein